MKTDLYIIREGNEWLNNFGSKRSMKDKIKSYLNWLPSCTFHFKVYVVVFRLMSKINLSVLKINISTSGSDDILSKKQMTVDYCVIYYIELICNNYQ